MSSKILHQTIGLAIVLMGLAGILFDRYLPIQDQYFPPSYSVPHVTEGAVLPVDANSAGLNLIQPAPVNDAADLQTSDSALESASINNANDSDEVTSPDEEQGGVSPAIAEVGNSQPVLSDRVTRVIEEVQTRQLAGQWEEALNEMNALYTEFEDLNSFEQSTLLNFYTNTLIALRMHEESIAAFSLMLTIDELRARDRARALLSLGQLNTVLANSSAAISHYNEWLEFTEGLEEYDEERVRVLERLSLLQGLSR